MEMKLVGKEPAADQPPDVGPLAVRKFQGLLKGGKLAAAAKAPTVLVASPTFDLGNLTVHQVAREGNVTLMKRFIESHTTEKQLRKNLNRYDDNKFTPLHYAARYNHYDMLQLLLENGADVRNKGEEDTTAIHLIAKAKGSSSSARRKSHQSNGEIPPDEFPSALRLLVKHGAQINEQDAWGLTPLHYACTQGNHQLVLQLLDCVGMQIEIADSHGFAPLHNACLHGHAPVAALLLQKGANVRCRDKDSSTPLHLACIVGSVEITEMIFRHATGAKVEENEADQQRLAMESDFPSTHPNLPLPSSMVGMLLKDADKSKNLPIHLAIENGHAPLVELCIEMAKQEGLEKMINERRANDDSCLHLAVGANNLNIVKVVVANGGDVGARNRQLTTPLALACQLDYLHIARFLREAGADVEAKDANFMTPLMVAARYGNAASIMWLLECGADVTATDKDDKTCLMWAAEEDRVEALKVLLRVENAKVLMEETDKCNNTALHLASQKGNEDSVKLLLDNGATPDSKNDDDRTSLHLAAMHGFGLLVPELILKDRSTLNSTDQETNTALHLAIINGKLKSVIAMMQNGANIESRNAKKWRPLDCAAACGWSKIAQVLLEAGANIMPAGKIKTGPLHLACQYGNHDVVNLLLEWKSDVTLLSADSRNAMDFAIDFGHKECVLSLLNHHTWLQSLRHAYVHPGTGMLMTPLRKLIQSMSDVAEVVCNKCISDNGKSPDDDKYAVKLLYELLDDTYATSGWLAKAATADGLVISEENMYKVYEESGNLTPDAHAYDDNTTKLQQNHPLNIMVESKCEKLLVHPLVNGLLTLKWNSFGRYLFYGNMFFLVVYLIMLNVYMLLMPPFYQLDWMKMAHVRNVSANQSADDILNSLSSMDLPPPGYTVSNCLYYRAVVFHVKPVLFGCNILDGYYDGLRIALMTFSILNLLREAFQAFNMKKRYLGMTNVFEVTLYILSLLVTVQFDHYNLDSMELVTAGRMTISDHRLVQGVQKETGLMQEWQQKCGAIAVFLSWMGLLFTIQKLPKIGIYVVMFLDVLKTFFQFFIIFVFCIFGFTFAFTILMGNQRGFEIWYEALVTVTTMMVGEINFSSRFFSADHHAGTDEYFSEVYTRSVSMGLFAVFLVVMTIVIMNLLVGLAVGDIMEIQDHAVLERFSMTVELTLDVEFNLPKFLRKKWIKREHVIFVNSSVGVGCLQGNHGLNMEELSKILDVAIEDQQEELRDASERVLLSVATVRSNLTELMADQTELKQGIRAVRDLVTDARREAATNSDMIRTNLGETREELETRIDSTRSRLTDTTSSESSHTRGKVEGTLGIVTDIQQAVHLNKTQLDEMRIKLQNQIDEAQRAMIAKTEAGVAQCLQMRADVERQVSEMRQAVVEKSEENMAGFLSVISEMRSESQRQFDEIKLLYASEQLTSSV